MMEPTATEAMMMEPTATDGATAMMEPTAMMEHGHDGADGDGSRP